VQHQLQIIVARNRGGDQDDVGEHAENAKRDHGSHGVGRNHKDRRDHAAGGSDVLG